MLVSLSLGTAVAYGSFDGFLVGIVDVHWVLINSLFYSLGCVVFPAALIFAILFIRYEWPLRSLFLPAIAFIYVALTPLILPSIIAAPLSSKSPGTKPRKTLPEPLKSIQTKEKMNMIDYAKSTGDKRFEKVFKAWEEQQK